MRRFLTRIARIYRYLDCNDGAPLSFIFQLQLQLLDQLLELVVVERFVAQPPAPVAQPLAAATARAFAQSVAAAA